MNTPLNCFWLSSQFPAGSHDSLRTPPGLSTDDDIAASPNCLASASSEPSPVARQSSSAPPIASPWLYVQTVCPLLVHDPVRPSLTKPAELIMPLERNQFQPVVARCNQTLSPAIRLCSAAVSRM